MLRGTTREKPFQGEKNVNCEHELWQKVENWDPKREFAAVQDILTRKLY